MRLFFAVVAALSLFGCVQAYSEPPMSPALPAPHVNGMTESVADLQSKTAALVEVDGVDAQAYCSAVWVAPEALLTANHCVDERALGEKVLFVTREDMAQDDVRKLDRAERGRLVARDEAHDLALIGTASSSAHGVTRLASDVWVGEATQTMGHPLGLLWSYSTGVVAATRLDDDGTRMVQATSAISPGNSGGGLFNAAGELLGVCHAYFPRGENLNVYIHVDYVRSFLSSRGIA